VSLAEPARDALAEPCRAAISHGPVHEARGAEAAAPLAATAALHEEHVAEDGFRAQNLRRGLRLVEPREVAAHDPGRERTVVVDAGKRPVPVVARVEAIGPIGAGDVLGALEDGVAAGRPRRRTGDELG